MQEPIELGLCEVEHIMLRPNQLYRFIVMPGCEKCKALDVYSSSNPSPRENMAVRRAEVWEAYKRMRNANVEHPKKR